MPGGPPAGVAELVASSEIRAAQTEVLVLPTCLLPSRGLGRERGRGFLRGAPVTPSLLFGKTGRSAFQCLQQFQQHNKALKRKEWTEQEDRMLTQLVQEMRVGSHIPYRKSKGAQRPPGCPRAPGTHRAGGFLRGGKKSGVPGPVSSCQAGPFGVHEASLPPVVYYMEGRDSMQLIYRWTKSLDPSLKKGFWAPEEDAVGVGGAAEHRPLGGPGHLSGH